MPRSWRLHSLKLTYLLKMVVSTRNLLFHGSIFSDKMLVYRSGKFRGFPQQKLIQKTRIINFAAPRLNDLFGIQARGGCACAGPYGQNLLGLDASTAHAFDKARGEFFLWTKKGEITEKVFMAGQLPPQRTPPFSEIMPYWWLIKHWFPEKVWWTSVRGHSQVLWICERKLGDFHRDITPPHSPERSGLFS